MNACKSSVSGISGKDSLPNILFISMDDVNDWVSPLGGYPGVVTPNMEKLARRGTLFTSAHCTTPTCVGSRASVFSGLYPHSTGVYSNRAKLGQSEALKQAILLPDYFKQHGYQTIGIGKITHRTKNSDFGHSRVWDEYLDYPSKFYNLTRSGRGGLREFNYGVAEHEDITDWQVSKKAASMFSNTFDKPFFLGVGLNTAHLAYFTPQSFYDIYDLDKITIPPSYNEQFGSLQEEDLADVPDMARQVLKGARTYANKKMKVEDRMKRFMQAYLAAVTYSDYCFGVMLNALEKSAYKDNTIVVLWSDHGYQFGEKTAWTKFTLWERSTRVPLIISAPGMNRSVVNHPVSLVDIYPTLADIALSKKPTQCEGKSLMPLMKNPNAPFREGALSAWIVYKQRCDRDFCPAITIRTEDYRLIKYIDNTYELYDHKADPHEWHNLYYSKKDQAKYKDVVARLDALLPPWEQFKDVDV